MYIVYAASILISRVNCPIAKLLAVEIFFSCSGLKFSFKMQNWKCEIFILVLFMRKLNTLSIHNLLC